MAGGRGRRPVPGRPRRLERRHPAPSPAPATPARPAWRSPCPSTARRSSGKPSSLPACSQPDSARATPCDSRPVSRCTATSSVPGSRRCRPASVGSSAGSSLTSAGATHSPPNGRAASIVTSSASTVEGRRPPRAECPILVDGNVVGTVTSGNFSPTLGHGIALGFVPPHITIGASVDIDVRGTAIPATVVATPFVGH